MTKEQAKKLRSGDEVTWNDPDNDATTRTDRIGHISVCGDIAFIQWEDGDEVQAFVHELS